MSIRASRSLTQEILFAANKEVPLFIRMVSIEEKVEFYAFDLCSYHELINETETGNHAFFVKFDKSILNSCGPLTISGYSHTLPVPVQLNSEDLCERYITTDSCIENITECMHEASKAFIFSRIDNYITSEAITELIP